MDPFEPTTPAPPTGRAFVLAALVLIAVIAATYFAVRPDSETELETAVPDTTAVPIDDEADGTDSGSSDRDSGSSAAGDSGADPAPPPRPPAEAIPTEELARPAGGGFDDAADSAFGGGVGTIVHGPDGFAELGWGQDGLVARLSPDGTEWSESPVSGLPEQSSVRTLDHADDLYVAVVEQYPEYDETDEPFFFDDYEAATFYLATSEDLLQWSTSELPMIEAGTDSDYGTSVGLVDAAVGDAGIVVIYALYPQGPNEMRLLFDAGLIDEDDFDSYCGMSWESFETGDAISVYSCDHEEFDDDLMELEERMADAESGEEIEALESEFERFEPTQTEIARIEPGSELWEALAATFEGPDRADVGTVVLTGPIGGPYETVELDTTVSPSSVVATSDGYMVLFTDFGGFEEGGAFETTSRVLRSNDGVTWSGPETITTAGGVWSMDASGSLVVAAGGTDDGRALTLVSTDSGVTWSQSEFGRELYGVWVMPLGGPAGMALWIEGATEPYPEFPMPTLRAEKDGYVVELLFEENLLRLIGPDGEVIHELADLESTIGSPEVPGVLREDPGDALTFLDPETGDDLVTFTEDDVEEQFAQAEAEEFEIEEPPRVRQLWLSSDGVTWTELEAPEVDYAGNSYAELAAVGDDEVLVRINTWLEPPPGLFDFEMEDREPTEAEITAIDDWYGANDGGNRVEWIRIPVS